MGRYQNFYSSQVAQGLYPHQRRVPCTRKGGSAQVGRSGTGGGGAPISPSTPSAISPDRTSMTVLSAFFRMLSFHASRAYSARPEREREKEKPTAMPRTRARGPPSFGRKAKRESSDMHPRGVHGTNRRAGTFVGGHDFGVGAITVLAKSSSQPQRSSRDVGCSCTQPLTDFE